MGLGLPLPQVRRLRGHLGLPTRPSIVHCEGTSVKAFMSLIVRRNDDSERRDP